MTSNNAPNYDPIIAVYGRLIELAQNARRERQKQQVVETAVSKTQETAVNGRNEHDNEPNKQCR